MPGPNTALRSRVPGEDGYRTPYIEDHDHPINMWRAHQDRGPGASYFSSAAHMNRDRHDRFQELGSGSSTREGNHHEEEEKWTLPWRERLKHTTWAYFTLTMATGGIANVLNTVPFRSQWLEIVGLIFFFLNIVLFIGIWAMLLTRFFTYPETFRASFVHPTESLFVPAFAVSFGTILITITEYGASHAGAWLTSAVHVLFWLDVAIAFILSITIYMILWTSLTFTIAQMTPIWIFPAYPLLIIGPHAANLSKKLPDPRNAIEVIVGGFTVQGIGFLVSLTIYSAFVYRLMTQKLPADPLRPGMFVSVGPAAFTCSGTIGMASNLQHAIAGQGDETFMGVPAVFAAMVLKLVANWASLWLWGLAIWFFFVSAVSNIAPLYASKNHKIPFAMTWYSYIFPQTALTTATFRIADAFEIHAMKILGCVMTGLLVLVWFFVVGMNIRAIVKKQILWPDKGEDKEEGGFVRKRSTWKLNRDDQEGGRKRQPAAAKQQDDIEHAAGTVDET